MVLLGRLVVGEGKGEGRGLTIFGTNIRGKHM